MFKYVLALLYVSTVGLAALGLLVRFAPERDYKPPETIGAPVALPDRHDCKEIYGTAYRSGAEMQWFADNCSEWPQVKIEQASVAPRSAVVSEDPRCAQMRGKPYGSDADRQFFLQSCLGRQAQVAGSSIVQPQASAGPDRTDCSQIRGTAYRSENERRWYLGNCRES